MGYLIGFRVQPLSKSFLFVSPNPGSPDHSVVGRDSFYSLQ